MSFGWVKRAWSRKGFRRVTYVLVSGAVVTGSVLWTVRQPFFRRWLLGRLSTLVREETGLELTVRDLSFQAVQGRIILEDLSLGGDLLQADRLQVQVDFITLLGRNPHLWEIYLKNPRSRLDAKRLARIKLKPRPEDGTSALFRLDRLRVEGGQLRIEEPAWRLPHATFTYQISGKGLGPNRLATEVDISRMTLQEAGREVEGQALIQAVFSDLSLELTQAAVRLGGSRLVVKGNYAPKAKVFDARMTGAVDVAQVLRWVDPKAPTTWEGRAELAAEAHGKLTEPAWKLALHGKSIQAQPLGLQPATLELKAAGNMDQARIEELLWDSSQGKVTASGEWKRGTGSQLAFHGERVGLAPLASFVRVDFLSGLALDITGTAVLPGNPWQVPALDEVEADAKGQILRGGEPVGRLDLGLAAGELAFRGVDLRVPELAAEGSGTMQFGKAELVSIAARGTAQTDASVVADVLHAWDIGEGRSDDGRAIRLGMAGQADAQADITWDRVQGFRMTGHAEVESPRWHGAVMDHLRADVTIQDDQLRIENIESTKGEGTARGSLWLTWQDLAPGQEQIDMTYEAARLPIEEGLRAGDVGDLPIQGIGGGQVRIHGPYDRIRIEATGVAEAASVFGVKIPAATGVMDFDVSSGQLEVKHIKVAERLDQLGAPGEGPTGLLALEGQLNMDLDSRTWKSWIKGKVDSQPLALPGPRFQAVVDGACEGPWTAPFGPWQLPLGRFTFEHGRIFLGQQSLEGLRGQLITSTQALQAELGMDGKSVPLASVELRPAKEGFQGTARVHVGTDSAETAHLAGRLTDDLLKDGALDLHAEGAWTPAGLQWKGQVDHLVAHFSGFDLTQQGPAPLVGDGQGARLALDLQGTAVTGSGSSAEHAARIQVQGQVPFSLRRPMNLSLKGTAELANLKVILDHLMAVDEFSLLADMKPEGAARFDLQLGGTYPEPMLDGLLTLANGKLQIRTYPQSVEDLSCNLHFKGREIRLLESDPLRGRLAQGMLKAWGMATWEPGGLTAYDFQTRLDDFQFRDIPEGFELYGSLEAVLQGTKEEGGILSGTIKARRMVYQADINLRDLILASTLGGPEVLRSSDPDDPLGKIDLDLDLVLQQPWEFDTNLLQLQGRPVGAFKILGTLAEPGLKGRMNVLPGGRLTNLLPAGDVVLQRGTIEWLNPRDRYPVLDMEGRVDVPPYVVHLAIHGSLDSLEMRQTSTPSLRPDEITAILIDPSLAPTIGGLSGPSAQASLNSGFASTGSGLVTTLALANFQESLRRTFKLDRVNVAWRTGTGTGASETSVTLGKNVQLFGHRVPLVVTHQQSDGVSTVSGQIEWRFGNLVLVLGLTQSGRNGLSPSGEIQYLWSPGW